MNSHTRRIVTKFPIRGLGSNGTNEALGTQQRGSLQEYIEQFQDLQVVISDMSHAEALDVFKRRLKEGFRQEVMVSNPQTVFEAIRYAQQIDGALGVAQGGEVTIPPNAHYGGPTPMELRHLWQWDGYARPFYGKNRRDQHRGREPIPHKEIAPQGGGGKNHEF